MMETNTESNRRRYPRFKAPILYRVAPIFSSRKPLTNIGLGGIRIYSDEEFKIGKRFEVELFLPEKTSMTCTARVAWLKSLPEGAVAKYDVGLEFLDMPDDVLNRLEKVLDFEAPAE